MTSLAIFDWVIEQDLTGGDPAEAAKSAFTLADKHAQIEATFTDPQIIARAKEETRKKHPSRETLEQRLTTLKSVWPDLQNRLRTHMMRSEQMENLLRTAGAPTCASDIGVDLDNLKATFLASRFIRSRYTLPDLLEETGLLERAANAVIMHPKIAAG